MLGKVIAHAPTRSEAAQVLARALAQAWLPGVITNREQLVRILSHPAFLAGELHTHFLEQHAGELAAPQPGLDRLRVAAIAATLASIERRREPAAFAPPGWRNVRSADQPVSYQAGDAAVQLAYRPAGDGFEVAMGGKTTPVSHVVLAGDRVTFTEYGQHRRSARVITAGARTFVLADGALTVLVEEPRFPDHAVQAIEGGLVAPMPGKVVKVLVTTGEEVVAGAALVVLEAMKMEHTVRATAAGTVRELHVAVGDQVDADRLLAVVT
jgi:acetyl/propionyl-CoA carboxylase alpha subunit